VHIEINWRFNSCCGIPFSFFSQLTAHQMNNYGKARHTTHHVSHLITVVEVEEGFEGGTTLKWIKPTSF
jgi:hypothetical protein